MNDSKEQIYLEIATEMFRDFPELKPKGKNSLNYWITSQK
jgi:hypothetical protein